MSETPISTLRSTAITAYNSEGDGPGNISEAEFNAISSLFTAAASSPEGRQSAIDALGGLPALQQAMSDTPPSYANYSKLIADRSTSTRSTTIDTSIRSDPKFTAALGEVATTLKTHPMTFPKSKDMEVMAFGEWHEQSPGVYTPNGKTKPSEAMQAFLDNPKNAVVDCAMAQQLVLLASTYKMIGAESFDKWCGSHGGLKISFGEYQGAVKAGTVRLQEAGKNVDSKPPTNANATASPGHWLDDNMRPGDAVYFMCPNAGGRQKSEGWGGENAVYLGGGLFLAHPMGVVTADQIVAELKEKNAYYGNPDAPIVRMEEVTRVNQNDLPPAPPPKSSWWPF